ncbi:MULTISPECIES: Clp protease ClpP [Sphingobacterium]|uniref:Clp protease ClpP n=1 Tax=Sphingobacterium TaxID=28453 RepID=UPI002591A686|nr:MULTISPECIES: ATP-dependent Clp protease proteolytic subunit [Sphingobacterium]
MKQRYFQVLASGTTGVGKLKIYGDIGPYWGDVNAADFLAVFNALESTCSRIDIHVNSPGGSVWEGLPIANAIKSSPLYDHIHLYGDGIEFSMAAILMAAAKKGNAHVAKGSLLMFHSASVYGYGNSKSLKKTAEDLEKYDDILASFLVDRLGLSLEQVKAKYFDGEDHYYTPAEALAEGLIDVIEDYEAEETPENVKNMSYGQVAAWFQGKINKIETNNSENQNNMFNKYSKLSELAKVAVNDRTNELFEAVNEQIQKAGVEGVTVVSDSYLEGLENASTENTGLKTKVTDLENSVTQKDARIAELEKQVKDLGSKPAEQPVVPVTDKNDTPDGGKKGEVEDFTTDYDREAIKLFGK